MGFWKLVFACKYSIMCKSLNLDTENSQKVHLFKQQTC